METLQNDIIEQIYRAFAIVAVTTAALVFVAPFLVVAAGLVIAVLG